MARNKIFYKLAIKIFFLRMPFSYKLNTNLKFITENIHIRFTSVTYLDIAAKWID